MSDNLAGKALADLANLTAGEAPAEAPAEAEGGGDNLLTLVDGVGAQAVYVVPGGADAILAKLANAARSLVADVTTKAGREAVASNAYRVARSKTYLDNLGKDFVADLRAQTTTVDRVRKRIRDELDGLRDEVRRPLTEYEKRQAAREAALRDRIQKFADLGRDLSGLRLSALVQRWTDLQSLPEPTKEDFAEFFEAAVDARRIALEEIEAAGAAAEVAELRDRIQAFADLGLDLNHLRLSGLRERLAELEALPEPTEANFGALFNEAREARLMSLLAIRKAMKERLAAVEAKRAVAVADAERREADLEVKLAEAMAQIPAPAAPTEVEKAPAAPAQPSNAAARRRASLWLATALMGEWPITKAAADEIAERLVSQIADGLAFGLQLVD